MSNFVYSALDYNFTPLEYDFQEMALTSSRNGLGMDQTNHIQRCVHVKSLKLALTPHLEWS